LKIAIFEGVHQFGPQFQLEWDFSTNHSSCRKNRCIALSWT